MSSRAADVNPRDTAQPLEVETHDVVVIGGGFFGLRLALHARRAGRSVLLLESSDRLMGRASRYNQARVHTGYHYPRAFVTARRSAIGSRRFIEEYRPAIDDSFTAIYAIARVGSRVTPTQFERFSDALGVPLERDEALRRALFDPRHVAAAYRTVETAFNPDVIRDLLADECAAEGVEIRFGHHARYRRDLRRIDVDHRGETYAVDFSALVAATYGAYGYTGIPTAIEIDLQLTELCMMEMPQELRDYGVTVMDGPFFSVMPFPAKGLHSLSHVTYTPHRLFTSRILESPYSPLDGYGETEVRRMVQASARLMPGLLAATYCGSHFEMKALPRQSAHVDSRPIIWEVAPDDPRVVSVLGSKLDTIYDAESAFDGFLLANPAA